MNRMDSVDTLYSSLPHGRFKRRQFDVDTIRVFIAYFILDPTSFVYMKSPHASKIIFERKVAFCVLYVVLFKENTKCLLQVYYCINELRLPAGL